MSEPGSLSPRGLVRALDAINREWLDSSSSGWRGPATVLLVAAVGLLGSMLGFGETAVALMIALYMAQDSFGTACNVTGDGAIALLVDQAAGDSASQAERPAEG